MALTLRPAQAEDARLLWEWVNDPSVRAAAFRSDPIGWNEHQEWFRQKATNPSCTLFVVLDDELPVGQVRFDIGADGFAEVDVSIAPEHRGRRFATEALRAACGQLRASRGALAIVAYVKPWNEASKRAFTAAGFKIAGCERREQQDAVRMVLE